MRFHVIFEKIDGLGELLGVGHVNEGWGFLEGVFVGCWEIDLLFLFFYVVDVSWFHVIFDLAVGLGGGMIWELGELVFLEGFF